MLNLVVLVAVDTELFEFFTADHLEASTRCFGLLFLCVVIGIGSEATDLNFTCSDSALRINNDSDGWILNHLHSLLGIDINTRQPATIPRVRVVPPTDILWSVDTCRFILVVDHEPISLLSGIHSRFSTDYRQPIHIHHIHGVTDGVAL